jgi:hypothetical protein
MHSTQKQLAREKDSRATLSSGVVGGYLFDGGITDTQIRNMQPLTKPVNLKALTATLNGTASGMTDNAPHSSGGPDVAFGGKEDTTRNYQDVGEMLNNSMNMSMAPRADGHVLDNLDPSLAKKYKYDIRASKLAQPGSELKSVAASAQNAAESSQRWSFTLRTDIPMTRKGEGQR